MGNQVLSKLNCSSEDVIFYGCLIIIPMIESVCRIYVIKRQVRVCEQTSTMPDEIKDLMRADLFEALRYKYIQLYKDTIVDIVVSEMFKILVLASNIIYFRFWVSATKLAVFLGYPENSEIVVSLSFVFLVNLCMSIPAFALYILSIRDLTGIFMVFDFVLEFVIVELCVIPIVGITLYVLLFFGTDIWLYISLISLSITFSQEFLYPLLIFPLVETYVPLYNGRLRTSIEQLATNMKFPLGDVYVKMELEPSEMTNAYVHSIPFVCHRVVIYEQLFFKIDAQGKEQGLQDNEIAALVAHELGHWKLNHSVKKFIVSQLKTFSICLLTTLLCNYSPMYTAIGFPRGMQPMIIGLCTIHFILPPVTSFLDFTTNFYYRREEFMADQIVVNSGYEMDFKKALLRREQVMHFPIFDSAFSCYHFSQPSLLERFHNMRSSLF